MGKNNNNNNLMIKTKSFDCKNERKNHNNKIDRDFFPFAANLISFTLSVSKNNNCKKLRKNKPKK